MQSTPKHKKRLLSIFLIPLIGIVLTQGILLFSMLRMSGVKTTMENNVVETDTQILENRQMALQNTMVGQWGSLSGESQELSAVLENLLNENKSTVDDFLSSSDLQELYLQQVFHDMVTTVQQNTASGLFLLLANDSPTDESAQYNGFFVRDSDPSRKTASNTDLLMERGDKSLARNESISLDNPWTRKFELKGKGKRSADDFFYEPYTAAVEHPDTNMVNLGYWSMPFILEDSYMDNHHMITYSLPLEYNGTIYGVLGVEASLGCLEDYMDVRELDQNLNAGYILAKNLGDGQHLCVAGKGLLYESTAHEEETFTLKEESIKNLYQVENASLGKQKIYAMISPLNLYSNNVPYTDTEWELCALVTENSIYETGRNLYRGVLMVIAASIVLGILVVVIVVKKVMNPFYRLMNSVRGGVEGIREFVPSQIMEIDELHNVVENVTEAQKKTEEQLIEEKERYRVAIESSQDMFFTYRRQEQRLEIVNTEDWDGIWDCGEHPEIWDNRYVHPLDRKGLVEAFQRNRTSVETEFRMMKKMNGEYEWYSLSARVVLSEEGQNVTVVGYLHNIQQQKEREMKEIRRKTTDPVTSFYRQEAGFRVIQEIRCQNPDGILSLVYISSFRNLNEQYGLVFGDILLEQLADFLRSQCAERKIPQAVFVRAGSAEISVWFPGMAEAEVRELLTTVCCRFSHLVHDKTVKLELLCGIAHANEVTDISTLLDHAKTAIIAAKRDHASIVVYEQLPEKEKAAVAEWKFGEIVSVGYTEQMSLVSIALNLFDRGSSISACLDLLAARMRKVCTLTDLLITSYNRENMVNSLEYQWKIQPDRNEEDNMIRCTEADFADFTVSEDGNAVYSMEHSNYKKSIFRTFLNNARGLAVNMTDNGLYCGTIFFAGLDEKLFEDEGRKKELREIATVIQNRMNQEKHDLAAQAKADFLARMSHEIRTPMNGIIGMTEIALKNGQTEERRVDCLQKIKGSSEYLLTLVNDILDMSKIESGKMQITEEKVDLKKKLHNLRNLIESKLTEKHMHYTENIDLIHDWFQADELRISQILINMLGNAIKYTYDGGHIKFEAIERSIDDTTSEIYFAVSDDGIGISPEDQQMVFQNFEQVRQQDGVYRQGTGLGLAISNRLIHMMGSRIILKSELGKGSVFSFVLRLKLCEADTAENLQITENVKLEGKRILIAEDNELNREIIQTILEDYGILTETAVDGQEAVEMMEASEPGYYDMIFMDIMMPRMNGLEATRQIRRLSRPDCRTIPIVAMTANAFAEEQKQSIASGMNAHLSKPLSMEKLQETLNKYLS